MVDRVVRVSIIGNADSLILAANQARTALSGLANTNLGDLRANVSGVGTAAEDAGKQATGWAQAMKTGLSVVGIQAGFDGVKQALNGMMTAGLDFQGSMNTLHAVTGANTEQMKALSDQAMKLGADISIPGASAGDAATAMKELAKGGFDVAQAMTASKGTLMLATAAQISSADAATIQVKALNAFRLGAGEAMHVANTLANAANSTTGEITDMAMALQQSATVARSMGIGLDDTVNMLALFAKNGVMASDAGTSMKTMLSALQSPTKQQAKAMKDLGLDIWDAQGQFVGQRELVVQLSEAYKGMTVQQYNSAASMLFGTDAIRAANIAGVEGVAGWDKQMAATTKAGGIMDLTSAQTAGLTGALDALVSTGSTTATEVFLALQPAMTSVVRSATSVMGALSPLAGAIGAIPAPVIGLAAALAALILLKGPLAAMWASMQMGLLRVKGEMLAASFVMRSARVDALVLAATNGTTAASFGLMAKASVLASFSLRALGASLKAAFLSNPIGWAIMGVTTALSFLVSMEDDASTATGEYTAILDAQTGALVANANALVAEQIAKDGLLDKTTKVGLKPEDVRAAVQYGNENNQLNTLNQTMIENAKIRLQQAGLLTAFQITATAHKRTLDEEIDATLKSTDGQAAEGAVLGDLASAYRGLQADAGKMQNTKEAWVKSDEAAQASTMDVVDANVALAANQQQVADAIKAVTDAMKGESQITQTLQGDIDKLSKFTQFHTQVEQALQAQYALSDTGKAEGRATSARKTEAAYRSVQTTARATSTAEADLADKQQTLADLQDHGTLSAKDLASAQDSVAQAAQGVIKAQDDVVKSDAKSAKDHVKALEDLQKARQEAAKADAEALKSLREAERKADEDRKAAVADLLKTRKEAIDDEREARENLIKTEKEGARDLSDTRKALNKTELQGARDLSDAKKALLKTEKEAAENLAEAEEKLAWSKIDPAASDATIRQATKDVVKQKEKGAEDNAKAKQDLADTKAKVAEATAKAKQDLADTEAKVAAANKKAKQDLAEAKAKGAEAVKAAQKALRDAEKSGKGSVSDARQKLKDTQASGKDSVGKAGQSVADQVISAADEHAQAEQRVAEAQKSAAEAQVHLTEVQATGVATSAQLSAAENAVATAKDGVASASDAQKDALDAAGKAARDAAADAYADKAAHGDLKGAVKAGTAEMVKQRAEFIKTATQSGLTRAAAKKLADQYGLIPAKKKTTFEAIGLRAALDLAKKLNAELVKTNNKTVRFAAVGNVTYQYPKGMPAPTTNMQGVIGQEYARTGTVPSGINNPMTANANQGLPDHGATMFDQHTGMPKAGGGWVSGGTGPTADDVPINASRGEFVVKASRASKYRSLLEMINGDRPGFAAGGAVSGGTPVTDKPTVALTANVPAPDVAAFPEAWGTISDTVQGAWKDGIAPTLDLLGTGTTKVGQDQRNLVATGVTPTWTKISAAVKGSWDGTVKPTFTSLNAGIAGVGWNHGVLKGTTDTKWTAISSKIAGVQGTLTNPGGTFGKVTAGLVAVGDAHTTLKNTTDTEWGHIGWTTKDTFDKKIKPAHDNVTKYTDAVGGYFKGISKGAKTSNDDIKTYIDKIDLAIDAFFKKIDKLAPTKPAAKPAAPKPAVPKADGGIIIGGTGPRADDVHIAASGGEYVVNAEATARNRAALDRMNYGGAYADGGYINGKAGDAIATGVTGAIVTGAERALGSAVDRLVAANSAGGGDGGSGIYPKATGARGKFLDSVLAQQGTGYVWGGAGPPPDFDCSGLMSWGLIQAGVGKGRLTAQDFNLGFPHISTAKPGDMVTFDTGRIPGGAGHIGAVVDPSKGLMMHTDGAGPARVSDYKSRDGGPLSIIDPIGGGYVPVAPTTPDKPGDPPSGGWLASILKKIKGMVGGAQGGATATQNTVDPIQDGGAMNMSHGTAANVGPLPAGGVEERWRPLYAGALAKLGVNSPGALDNMMYQMHTESGGDPLAYNNWDRNFTGGHPSKSLLQTIPSTFRAYAEPGYSTNIWDPLSNAYSALNYVKANYGGVFPGHAYDSGGILPLGPSLAMNATASPEFVLTDQQWMVANSAMNHVISGGQGGGKTQIEITFTGDGAITQQMVQTATVTVNGALNNQAAVLIRSGGQS